MASPEFVKNTLEALESIQAELAEAKAGRDDHEKTIKELRVLIQQIQAQRTPHDGTGRRKFDTKHLKLVPYSGQAPQFKTFEFHLKEFIKRESFELFETMEKAERESEPTRPGFNGLDVGLDGELRWLLVNHTSGDAEKMVRHLSHCSGVETWRLMKSEVEPRGGAGFCQRRGHGPGLGPGA